MWHWLKIISVPIVYQNEEQCHAVQRCDGFLCFLTVSDNNGSLYKKRLCLENKFIAYLIFKCNLKNLRKKIFCVWGKNWDRKSQEDFPQCEQYHKEPPPTVLHYTSVYLYNSSVLKQNCTSTALAVCPDSHRYSPVITPSQSFSLAFGNILSITQNITNSFSAWTRIATQAVFIHTDFQHPRPFSLYIFLLA